MKPEYRWIILGYKTQDKFDRAETEMRYLIETSFLRLRKKLLAEITESR